MTHEEKLINENISFVKTNKELIKNNTILILAYLNGKRNFIDTYREEKTINAIQKNIDETKKRLITPYDFICASVIMKYNDKKNCLIPIARTN